VETWEATPVAGAGTGESAEALAALQRVTDTALAHLALDDLLEELMARIAAVLGSDTATILLADHETGMLHARAAKGIEEEVEQGVRIPIGRGFAGKVAAERRPVTIPDIDRADVLNPLLRQKGIRSLLGVPLVVEGRVLGVMHVGSLAPRVFTAREAELLQVVADRVALAIDHAQLFERERAARERSERAVRVLESVQRVTDAALAYLSTEDLLDALLDRMREILSVDTAAILLLEHDGRMLRARAAKGIEEEVEQGVRIPVGRGFAGRIAAERHPIAILDVDHADVLNPLLRQKGIRSLLGVPLLVSGRVIGVLHVGSLTPRAFTEEDRDLLQLAADRAALAIDHAELYEQRRLAEALQRTLLPQDLGDFPGLEVTARYLPAAHGTNLGGDWYDLFPVGGGRVGIAVGDVVGRGLPAAALMAQLRTALRSYAVDGHGPSEVVDRLNRMLAFLRPATMTTAAYLTLDPEHDSVDVVSAGHLPPLVIAPDGTARYLDVSGGVALGVTRGARYRVQTHRIEPGSTLVLFTDGVVEVRGESLDDGLERLRGIAERRYASVDALCDGILEEMVADGRPADDVAILAVRLVVLGHELSTRWPAQPEALASVRHLLRRWLRHHGAGDDEIYDITVACQEACANAVEHAYAPGSEAFEVEARMIGTTVEIAIRDRGQWRRARGTHRGRGLPMMEALMDSVHVQHAADGTAVVLRRELGRAGKGGRP
jgi:GAF domain-containing protein/anti-sigma regulatory factor (Ser/Thr protein kinase)